MKTSLKCENCNVIFEFGKKDMITYTENEKRLKEPHIKQEDVYETYTTIFFTKFREKVRTRYWNLYDVYEHTNLGIKCPLCGEIHFIKEISKKLIGTRLDECIPLTWI